MMAHSEIIGRDALILSIWEEAVGVLSNLNSSEGSLIAKIGSVSIILPSHLEELLRPLEGERVGIIRTDDPVNAYRIRQVGG